MVSCYKSGVKVKSDGLDVSIEVGAFVTDDRGSEQTFSFQKSNFVVK